METLYLRTADGDQEISERIHNLTRWQRATLIVIGAGKPLGQLQHATRQMPEALDEILQELMELGLVARQPPTSTPAVAAANQPMTATSPDKLKDTRRYLTYLIGIVENAHPASALGMTIALKKATTESAIEALYPLFFERLCAVSSEDEARRLLGKLAYTPRETELAGA